MTDPVMIRQERDGAVLVLCSVAGLLLGVAEVFSVAYGASSYRDAVAFGMIILLLFLRPEGLFGSKEQQGGR